MTRRALVFAERPPAVHDFGFDSLGFKSSGPNFFGTTTTIEGGQYEAAQERDRWGRKKARSALANRHSDEDFFANPPSDGIATKTTVEVFSGR
jgi:hypothetical protein